MKITWIVVILCHVTFFNFGQEVRNIRLGVEGTSILITYDLDGMKGEFYSVSLFSSHDDFKTAMTARGDLGDEVTSGLNKQITWEAAKDLEGYKGNLQVKVKAALIPSLTLEVPEKVRRGKNYEIKWSSNLKATAVILELQQTGTSISNLGRVDNDGVWIWEVPAKQEIGPGFNIMASINNTKSASGEFRISRKIPLMLKVLPLTAVVGGLVAVLIPKKGSAPPIALPLGPN